MLSGEDMRKSPKPIRDRSDLATKKIGLTQFRRTLVFRNSGASMKGQ